LLFLSLSQPRKEIKTFFLLLAKKRNKKNLRNSFREVTKWAGKLVEGVNYINILSFLSSSSFLLIMIFFAKTIGKY
jgi:hypothetical protein